MSKVSLVGVAALLSLLGIGAVMTHQSSATAPTVSSSAKPALAPNPATQSTLSNALEPLSSAAKSLLYLPLMKRAIAASNPEILVEESVFADAEVRLTGIGPIQIGMTLEEATDALGLPLVPIGSNLGGDCAYYQPDSVSQALGFMVVDNRVIRVDVWPGSSLATVSGAKIGSTTEDIAALYPGQIEVMPNPYTKGEFLILTPQDPELTLFRLVFETDAEGKVVQYRAGQFPAVTWPDGCV